MRSILVKADRDPGMQARLNTALDLARANDGHVTLLIDTPLDSYVTVDPFGGTYVAREALDTALADDDALAEAVTAQLQREDVPFDVIQFEQRPLDAMAAAAQLADVAIVSRSCGYAGDLALAVRCPVLALPDKAPLQVPVRNACIAWDGGDEAAVALRSVAPMLAGSGQVHVLTVAARESGFPSTEALRYLSRHGIKAELHQLERGNSIEETLMTTAMQLEAELIVLGAFSHSRVRELLFGGVTRFFLDEKKSPPLLLAH
jgi:nucleotide-binding universal stress UspA family protein